MNLDIFEINENESIDVNFKNLIKWIHFYQIKSISLISNDFIKKDNHKISNKIITQKEINNLLFAIQPTSFIIKKLSEAEDFDFIYKLEKNKKYLVKVNSSFELLHNGLTLTVTNIS